MSKKNPITPWGKKKQREERERQNKVVRGAVSGGIITGIIGSAITSITLDIKIKKLKADAMGNINSLGNSTTDDEAQETSETETGYNINIIEIPEINIPEISEDTARIFEEIFNNKKYKL